MTGSVSLKEKFDLIQACIIIPTYNNAASLGEVIEGVAEYSDHIIVVNDGSTDNTLELVNAFPYVQLISYPK
ncbi:MAG TPA: glycosyltransferase, partial [Ferruginibacter sp.]|nr:glycosyltransferase [Ferruginibacter sp.]